jgi:hypothetical protein
VLMLFGSDSWIVARDTQSSIRMQWETEFVIDHKG